MSATPKELYFAAVRSNLKVFIRQAFSTIYPGKGFVDNWHIDAIVHSLEQSIEGHRPHLIINLPPRQLKSFIISVALPAYILGIDTSAKIICISYSDELAKTLSRDFRRIIESDWYREVFPEVRTAKMAEGEFVTDAGGGRYATSVGGTLTGRGGDFIIIDDPIKPEEAQSDKARNSTNEWYRSTLLSRLDDKSKSVLILVMQRLHVNDLTGYAEASGGFHKLSFPAIAENDEIIPISKFEKHHRHAGEALHEKWEGLATLASLRDQVGPYNFAAQYQQHPEAPEGALFKLEWFNIVEALPEDTSQGQWFVSIDAAASTSETADYSAISLIYADRRGYFIFFAEKGRWDYEALKQKASKYIKHFGAEVTFIVEAASAGVSLIQALRKSGVPCFHYSPRHDKQTRAALAVPAIVAGRVHIVSQPGKNAWVEPYLTEFVTFPNGRFDDQVDSLTQFIVWAEQRFNTGGKIYFMG